MNKFCRTKLTCGVIAFFLPLAAFGGQSLILNGSSAISVADPVLPATQAWRIEFQVHNFVIPPPGVQNAKLFDLPGTGVIARIYPDGSIESEDIDKVTPNSPCFVSTNGLTNALVRLQKDPKAMLFSCEIWNYDGTGYRSQVYTISSLEKRGGESGTIGPGATTSLGFFRIATTLVPLGGRPPTTADGGDWTELKFEGNLKDSSGRNHNASGAASYAATPNQVAFSYPRTAGAPSWSSWTSLRAGYPGQFDASASYSLADGSSAVACSWKQLEGPSTMIWSGQNTPTPTVEGLVFGTYSVSLQVTDAAGNTASANLELAAVATDDNGVVVNADPNVDAIFGPMIAFGENPWGFADERAMAATRLRTAAYTAQGLNPPSWTTPGRGTVSYIFNGVGDGAGAKGTSLAAPVAGPTDMAIQVSDASVLDLASLPTRILVGNSPREEIRICAASAQQGPATLTVCYDGRAPKPNDGILAAAQAWPKGTVVGQMKVTGSATSFLTDMCPAGFGPAGILIYSAGSVRLTPGSNQVVGSGTVWTTTTVVPGYSLRVAATHGGVPFFFWAYVAAVSGPTQLTLARPFPADADAGSFSYSVVQTDYRVITLSYRRPVDSRSSDQGEARTYFQTSGCESNTEIYVYYGHDIGSVNASRQTGMQYSYMEGFGLVSVFGPNFYGEDLAHRALYYRSGWKPALQTARVMSDHYVNSPQLAGGDVGGIPLLLGGGVVGGFAAAILDTADPDRPAWTDLRGFARAGAIGERGCSDYDARDSGYVGSWLTLAARFDPDPIQQAGWIAKLKQILARDQRCKGADNSWANGFLWNDGNAPISLTNGSAIATGTGIPPGICFGIASGRMSVTTGSATGLGSGFVPGVKIAVTGTRNGAPFTAFLRFNVNTDGSITLGAVWAGDSGSVSWIIENSDYMTTIAASNSDPQLAKNWACTWNSPSQITLSGPWDGPTRKDARPYSYTVAGFGQQPFMVGIKILQMKLASQMSDPVLSAGYSALAGQAAGWIRNTGYDPVTQGMFYGRIFAACEPASVPPPSPTFSSRTPGCNHGLDPSAIRAARVLTAEASNALRVYYESNPTPEAKAWGDTAYGSIWGNPLYTTGGVYSDQYYVRDENSNASLGAYKWTGFFFGMGMAHQWPAVRLGGVAAPRIRKVMLPIQQGVAARAQILVVEPCGKVDVFTCTSAASCEVAVDDRQGSHWYRVQYQSEDGKLVSKSEAGLIPRQPGLAPRKNISRR